MAVKHAHNNCKFPLQHVLHAAAVDDGPVYCVPL
jgi:hypothetical protein